ncbi:hypothetical protein ACPA9J_28075 [Pseudomonas aeruginosa]
MLARFAPIQANRATIPVAVPDIATPHIEAVFQPSAARDQRFIPTYALADVGTKARMARAGTAVA